MLLLLLLNILLVVVEAGYSNFLKNILLVLTVTALCAV